MSWEELRRQARSLENELDAKLATYSSLSSKPNLFRASSEVHPKDSSRSLHFVITGLGESAGARLNSPSPPSTVGATAAADSNRLSDDIDQLLQRLSRINDQMTEIVRELDAPPPVPNGSMRPPPGSTLTTGMTAGQLSQVHTAKRHREILHDYMQEYRQAKAKLTSLREREELLGSMYRSSSSIGSNDPHATSAGQSSATRLLLDEQERYYRSNRLIDDHIAVASAVRSKLYAQRSAMRHVSDGLHTLATRFPRIKQLITKIDWRHRKDSIILGLVIASCIAFLLIYRFS